MARKIGSQVKSSRRYGIALHPKAERVLAKRNYPPGVHGPNGRSKTTDFGNQLAEKQKAKLVYGLLEKQFRTYYAKAIRSQGNSADNLLRMLEMRLDNVIFRLGLATSRQQARQLVGHAHVLVNNKKVNVPSYQVKVGDAIAIRDKSQKSKFFTNAAERLKTVQTPSWLTFNPDNLTGKVVDLPTSDDIQPIFDIKTIIEFYSK